MRVLKHEDGGAIHPYSSFPFLLAFLFAFPVPSLRLPSRPLAHTSTVCVLLKSWSSYRLRARAC